MKETPDQVRIGELLDHIDKLKREHDETRGYRQRAEQKVDELGDMLAGAWLVHKCLSKDVVGIQCTKDMDHGDPPCPACTAKFLAEALAKYAPDAPELKKFYPWYFDEDKT